MPSKGTDPRAVVKKGMTNKGRMIFGLIATAGVFLSILYFTFTNVNKLEENANITRHTVEVLGHLVHVLSALSDAETGQRGYLLTGELKYLEPYNSGVFSVEKEIAEVKKLTEDNSSQQERIANLEILVEQKKAELQETVALRAEGRGEEAIAVVLSDRGKDIMDNIRVVIGEMEDEENELLEVREKELVNTQETTRTIILFGGLIGFFFALFAASFILYLIITYFLIPSKNCLLPAKTLC